MKNSEIRKHFLTRVSDFLKKNKNRLNLGPGAALSEDPMLVQLSYGTRQIIVSRFEEKGSQHWDPFIAKRGMHYEIESLEVHSIDPIGDYDTIQNLILLWVIEQKSREETYALFPKHFPLPNTIS